MTSYNGGKVAGRTVYRRRTGQTRYPELGRSTQLPRNVKSKKLEHRVKDISTIAAPDMLQRWYRRLVIQEPNGIPQSKPLGRPRMAAEIEQLVVRMANENPRWGYRRIQGALLSLGYDIDKTTVRNVLRRNHNDPTPIQGKAGMSWCQFIRLHWGVLDVPGFFEAQLSELSIYGPFSPSWVETSAPGASSCSDGSNIAHGVLRHS